MGELTSSRPPRPRDRGIALAFAFLLATGTGLATAPRLAAAATLPPGFQETVVFSGLVNPTVVKFAPDGRVFVAEKSGRIKVFDSLTDPTAQVFADLRTNVHDFWDRGLLGMTLDPDFATNPYIYVLYTYDHILGDPAPAPRWGDTCPNPPGATGDGCVVSGRLSRIDASGTTGGAEQVLIEDWCQQYPSHSIGSLTFGGDGALYVSAGDGASFGFADYGQDGNPLNPCGDPPAGIGGAQAPPAAEGGALRSQDLRTASDPTSLDGAILRVDPATGAALPTNPNADSADPNARRIVAYGLRNPFRIAARPGTGEIWVGDVGWATWEELNRITSPTSGTLNFGWPCYEGPNRQGSYDNLNLDVCENLYAAGAAAVTAPYYSYRHTDSVVGGEACANGRGSSTVGMAFYNGGTYPASYDGGLFFADYSRNCLWYMPLGTDGLPDTTKRMNFLTPASNPVHLEIGPDGDLFYVNLSGGAIHRIQYVGANQPPVARLTGTPLTGSVPLTVEFDGQASSDPEGGALTYAWDLDGDGLFDDGSGSTATFTYGSPGTYSARLRVTDPEGVSGWAGPVTIEAANAAPVPRIDTPAAGTTWKVGDPIGFTGSATDAEDGSLPGSSLRWDVVLKHCPLDCHEHPIESSDGTATGSFTGPDHAYPAYLELRLTATDAFGVSTTVSRALYPRTVSMGFATTPSGMTLQVGGSDDATPFSRTVIDGSRNAMTAISPQEIGGITYTFRSWGDGVTTPSREVIVGAGGGQFSATYEPPDVTQVPDTTPPTVTAPAHTLVTGSAMASGRLPVKLTWSGSDAGSVVARYEVGRQTDGGTWSASTNVTGTSLTPALASGRLYRFRVRGIDQAGNRSLWRYGPTFRLSAVSEAASAARYGGTWSSVSSASYWGGKARATSIAGRNVTFTFTGRSVAWVTLKSPARGKAAIYVNGAYQATVDLYSGVTQAQRVGWANTWSTSATRTVQIRVLGTSGRPRVDVDGFWVAG